MKEIYQQGGKLVANGCLNQAIVDEISSAVREKSGRQAAKKGSHIFFYVAFFSLLIAPGIGRAQGTGKQSVLPASAPTGVMKLTLDEAVSLALKQNPTEQIAIISAAESVQDKNEALAALLPQAEFDVKDSVQRINIAAFLGKKIPGFPAHGGPFQVFSAGPDFNAPILDLTLYRRYQAARHTMNASKADSLSTREQVILLVVSQYIGTIRDVASVQASESRVELAQALYDQAADLQVRDHLGEAVRTHQHDVAR